MYKEYLHDAGFDPFDCDAKQAFDVATTSRTDVIVTDLWLRGRDGLELIRKLRSDERSTRTTIVVVSGWVFPWHREKAYAAGCDARLPKRFGTDCLRHRSARWDDPTEPSLKRGRRR